jgi:hypothetical protein
VTSIRRFLMPIAIAAVLVAVALDLSKPSDLGIDFHTYEAAARVGLHHGWSHIYDQSLVAAEQKALVPDQVAQPFLSPPPTAWLTAPLAALPFWPSYYVWAAFTFIAMALALVWSSSEHGLARWVVAAAALAPWWVWRAVDLGQVVPLVAAGVVVAWRLLREHRDFLVGGALALIGLKANTAFLVPFALLASGRFRSFATFAGAAVVIAVLAVMTMGSSGISDYISQLAGPRPAGADYLTLEGAFGVGGAVAIGMRLLIIAATLVAAFRLRYSPGLVIAAGTLSSLLVAPYLHGADLCLLSAAAWLVWEERTTLAWRVPLAIGWLVASPLVASTGIGLGLNRWPLVEILLLAALVLESWRSGRQPGLPSGAAIYGRGATSSRRGEARP